MRSCKFLITFCLIAVMVLCLVTVMPTVAFAGESEGVTPEDGDISVTIPGASQPEEEVTSITGKCGENLTWTLNTSGTLTIKGTGAMDSYMDSPAPWADYANRIKTVTISSASSTSVTSIGDNAFAGCTALGLVTLRNSVTSIGYSAFESCYNLPAITLPESVASIGMNAFAYTPLETITIPAGVTAIKDGTFKGCDQLKTIYVPSSVNAIAPYAFDGCTALQDVYFYGEDLISATYTVAEGNDPFLEANWLFMLDDGWYFIPELNAWIYMKDYATATGWQLISNKWYYFDSNGIMQTGWLQDGGKWYFFNASGAMVTGWLQDGSKWYFFNASGAMATGWLQSGKTWYYFNASGAMVTGWLQSGKTWYYFNASGAMATGWLQSGKTWYYFNASGAMATGWLQSGNTWYFFNTSGAMVTGWLKQGNTWYYFNASGTMVTGSLKIGSKTYKFNSSGACLNP